MIIVEMYKVLWNVRERREQILLGVVLEGFHKGVLELGTERFIVLSRAEVVQEGME